MNFISSLFETYEYLRTEWFWSCATFFVGLTSAIFGLIMWRIDSKQKLREEKMQTLSRIVQIDLELKDVYRDAWAKITSYKGDADKEIYHVDVKDIKADHIRMSIFQIIDILSDAHKYYGKFEMTLDESWETNFYHTFNPHRKKAFVTAFMKYRDDERFGKEFVSFVETIIKYYEENQNTNITNSDGQEGAA